MINLIRAFLWFQLRREVLEVYHMVRGTIEDLKNRQRINMNSMDSTVTSVGEPAGAAAAEPEMTFSNIKVN